MTEKGVDMFHKYKRSKSGVRSVCKPCRSKHEGHSEQDQLRKNQWYIDNKELAISRAKEHYKENTELRKQQVMENIKRNPDKYRAIQRIAQAKRRSSKLNATVVWANLEKIKEIYMGCPIGYEVDHIIPLQGKIVSGLHIENNLQYLTIKENRMKSNKLEVNRG